MYDETVSMELVSCIVTKSWDFRCMYAHTFLKFLALNSAHTFSKAPNLISTFVLMLIFFQVLLTGDIVEVCSVCMCMSISHVR